MKTSIAGLQFIAKMEGEVLHPYVDRAGYPTIGVGHLIKAGEEFPGAITHEQAMQLLAADVLKCEREILARVKVPLTQHQFDALCAFAYNVGTGALWASQVIIQLNLGRHDDVPRLMMAWCHAGGKTDQGLVDRRRAEGRMWCTPDLPPAAPTGNLDEDELRARDLLIDLRPLSWDDDEPTSPDRPSKLPPAA